MSTSETPETQNESNKETAVSENKTVPGGLVTTVEEEQEAGEEEHEVEKPNKKSKCEAFAFAVITPFTLLTSLEPC